MPAAPVVIAERLDYSETISCAVAGDTNRDRGDDNDVFEHIPSVGEGVAEVGAPRPDGRAVERHLHIRSVAHGRFLFCLIVVVVRNLKGGGRR